MSLHEQRDIHSCTVRHVFLVWIRRCSSIVLKPSIATKDRRLFYRFSELSTRSVILLATCGCAKCNVALASIQIIVMSDEPAVILAGFGNESWYSSVGLITTTEESRLYSLQEKIFFFLHSVHIVSGAYPASFAMHTGSSFHEDK